MKRRRGRMSKTRGAPPKSRKRASARGAKQARRRALEALIDEATVDCYNEDEAFWGIYTLVEECVRFPFVAEALGNAVEVVGLDVEGSSLRTGMRLRVRKGGKIYTYPASDLKLTQSFSGRDALAAYVLWESGQ
jgi:hypothetical protein